jgi:hypothetical protein
MKFNKIVGLLIFFLAVFSILQAKRIEIKIEHTGYGKNIKEVYFSVYNTGDTILTDIEMWVDGIKREVAGGTLSPGNGFEKKLYLEFGDHFIEVKTPEGAYDSINITIPFIREKRPMIEGSQKKPSFIEENRLLLSILLLTLLTVIVFILFKKPKLKFELSGVFT